MSILRWLAAPLSPLYGGVVRLRNRAFDARPGRAARAEVPVVSIGNLSAGGTGKTPLTPFLAAGLEAAGWPNAVVSRGYGGKRAVDPMSVEPDSDPALSGDEPALMARRLGPGRVVVARRRLVACWRAKAQRPELKCLLLDDGFQHRALHRDLDLLLLDGVRRWGKGRMLPLGDLREPMDSARRAHALVVTRAGRVQDRGAIEAWWKRHGSGGPVFWVDFRIGGLRQWNGVDWIELPEREPKPALAWCGLGHPTAFFADLLVAGQPWTSTEAYPDHRGPTPRQLAALQARAQAEGSSRLVCTEKDAVKLNGAHKAVLDMPLCVAEQIVVGGEERLAWVAGRLAELENAAPNLASTPP